MKAAVLDIKGKDTGRKVSLNKAIYEIEPNDHAVYLDVKQYLANQRQGTHKSKERAEITGLFRVQERLRNKKEQVQHVQVVSSRLFFVVEVVFLDHAQETILSN